MYSFQYFFLEGLIGLRLNHHTRGRRSCLFRPCLDTSTFSLILLRAQSYMSYIERVLYGTIADELELANRSAIPGK